MINDEVSIVKVLLGDRSYDIRIGEGLVPGSSLPYQSKGMRGLIVTDENVDAFHGEEFTRRIKDCGFVVSRAVVPAGEATKDIKYVKKLYTRAIEEELDRSSLIFALGGGVVGDLGGFVAATYLRGIRYVQVPTTTLAMLDSSVGGKTGINLEEGKNLVGSFHQPVEVVIDLATLKTLPQREYISGLAELVKHAVIWDAELLKTLEEGIPSLVDRDLSFLRDVITRSCEIKAEVVAIDEKESGMRAALNFGHTLGHAVEKVAGYGGYLHGEAVSIGMVYSAALAVKEKGLDRKDAGRIEALLEAVGLPVRLGGKLQWRFVREAMLRDKKTRGSVPRFVLVEKPGKVCLDCVIDEKELERAFEVVVGC